MNIGNDAIANIQNRIQQIEQNFNHSAQVKPEQSFQQSLTSLQSQNNMRIDTQNQNMMSSMTQMPQNMMMNPGMQMNPYGMQMTSPASYNMMMNPYGFAAGQNNPNVRPQAQSNSVSCGQTSVAMSINSITGRNLTDMDIDKKYGFSLLGALNSETKSAGVNWRDGGEVSPYCWGLIDQKVNKEGLPVIVALNGPEFSPSGRGHIVTIVKTQGDTVFYADPANGQIKTTSKQAMVNAQKHPDGNFIFFPNRATPQNPYMAT